MLASAWASAACGPKTTSLPPDPSRPIVRNCDGDEAVVKWQRDADQSDRLARWCETVGPPLVVPAVPREATIRRMVVVSWNVHVGGGRVRELADLIVRRAAAAAGGEAGIVLLLQETFRGGEAVPILEAADGPVPGAIRPERPVPDVEEIARAMGWSALYVPSMRNGSTNSLYEREDRGTAVLSSEPLTDLTAIELPFGKQRRVAAMATVTPRGGSIPPFRVIAGHFDSVIGTRNQAETLAAYIDTMKASMPVVLGVDANAVHGRRDVAIAALEKSLAMESCGEQRTGPWLQRVDFMFSDLGPDTKRSCETLSERYGSDHLPLVLTVY